MKLMVMTLVVAMLLSMSAFAASVSYTSLVPTENGTDYSVTVNYAAADYATGDQVTLLVLKDSAEITWADDAQTVPANVIYIDQETIEGAEGSFTFAIAKTEVDGKNVYVKLGATSQAEAKEGTYTEFVKAEGGETVEVTVNKSVADSFGETGLAMISITPATPIAEGKVMKVNGATMFYTLYNGVKRYTALLKDYDAATAKFTVEDGVETRLIYGNVVTGNDEVDVEDAVSVISLSLGNTTADTDLLKLAGDVNGSGDIDVEDAVSVISLSLGNTTVPPILAE